MRVGLSLYIVFTLCVSPVLAQTDLDLSSTNRDGTASHIGEQQVTFGTGNAP